MAQKYGSEVAVVHIVNLDQNLQLLGIYRLSYPDPIKKKVEEARNEAQKWSTEIIRIAEQRSVRIKSDVIDSPMSVVSALVNYADRKGRPHCDWNKRKIRPWQDAAWKCGFRRGYLCAMSRSCGKVNSLKYGARGIFHHGSEKVHRQK